MNAPDLADEAAIATHGACETCGAPRRPSMSPTELGAWPLVCSAQPDHEAGL